jgi:hypothetical protein
MSAAPVRAIDEAPLRNNEALPRNDGVTRSV